VVNSDSAPASGIFRETWAEMLALLADSGRLARRHAGWALAAVAVAVVSLAVLYPHDRALLSAMHVFRGGAENTAHSISWQLGRWGDYLTYNLPLAVLIWIYGAATKSPAWRRVAIVAFLGAALAGLADDCLRLTLGRPRPDIYPHVPDGFYGPAKAIFGRYESFPSGHAASDVGMGVALLFVSRPLGLLTSVYALAVIWARMELNKHYPSDVLVGAIIGIYFGSVVGLAGRARR
jgi:membrane-associated phospholipid phosphatase